MKKALSLILTALLLTGCGKPPVAGVTVSETTAHVSQFLKETRIFLSDENISVDGNQEAVTTSHDIVYYEDRDRYDSGNPYGEGTGADKHTADEAAAHTVVNITKPGAYRVTGKLSAGQIRVDLGKDAYSDPDALVELILDNADISCTVAPAIVFENVYECDGNWSTETANAHVDTTAAGANLILEGSNTIRGSYVAKIYKDTNNKKKLVKQDGAIYSYMSLNVWGPGTLELTAENEGLGTQMHLTINSGNLRILSNNDGINANEDDVSVITINGGNLTIYAGLGEEGDGIDSNGYLVINGGYVYAAAKPVSDAGLDSNLGSFIHGGTVIATGAPMDWAESASGQVTMNLHFAQQQTAGAKLTVTDDTGAEIFSFEDDSQYARGFQGLILSHSAFAVGDIYHIYVEDTQMQYTGNSLGGFGASAQRPKGAIPENSAPSQFEHLGIGTSEGSTEFHMEDTVNAFSGITKA